MTDPCYHCGAVCTCGLPTHTPDPHRHQWQNIREIVAKMIQRNMIVADTQDERDLVKQLRRWM